jgi:hypothetical protein
MSGARINYIFDFVNGFYAVRIGKYWCKLKSPRCVELFSERNGYDRRIGLCFGWRILIRRVD